MKFIIGFLITIGLLIFVFVLIFRGGGDEAAPTQKQLVDYANTNVVVQMTTRGPVQADQSHKESRITVGSTETVLETFAGYQGNLMTTRSYPNNPEAYADFLRALQLNGYTNGVTDKSLADERGFCATGKRYVMSVKDGGRDIQRFWSTSCNGTATFKGKTTVIRSLFIAQVPDYNTLVDGTLR
ncbi:MAG TPA: hypothetical protein VF572_05440 [Candidatus Saccharimonadales bacterium]|jgi:hypothetical protein